MIQILGYTILLLVAMYFISQTAFKIVLIAIGMAMIAILALLLICWIIDKVDNERDSEE